MNQPIQIRPTPLFKSKTVIIERGLVSIERVSIRPKLGDVLRREVNELSQLPFALPDLLFRLLALNGDTRKMGDLLYEIMFLWSRATRYAIVCREGPQH